MNYPSGEKFNLTMEESASFLNDEKSIILFIQITNPCLSPSHPPVFVRQFVSFYIFVVSMYLSSYSIALFIPHLELYIFIIAPLKKNFFLFFFFREILDAFADTRGTD